MFTRQLCYIYIYIGWYTYNKTPAENVCDAISNCLSAIAILFIISAVKMEPILESKPFDYSMEDIRFGDENAKAEKAKQSFLQLKQKICRTNDVIQQYSNKVKECDYLKGEVENAKKETEEWKKQHFASLAKILEMKTARTALEKSKRILCRENAELEIKIAGDQKHLQQLMCKLGDIEDQHSEKLMEIDLEKSGLQSKVAELEKEIKLLHKTYDVKKGDITTKNTEKPKRGKKLRSPMKTSRSTGLSPEIDDEVKSNSEIVNTKMLSPQPSTRLDAILTTDIESEAISTTSDLPQLFNVQVPDDESIISVKTDTSEQISTPKPITFDKNIMTDEFYGIKDNVYPLLCDKCEAPLESMPVDKIFKIMTTVPPLLSTVPPSPIRLRRVDREIQTVDIPAETNVSHQNDSNVSLVLDKVQQTLETLEKQMKKNNKKRRDDQNTIPHCSHKLPTNCCNHNNGETLSQVNMMASFWNSMMKFADKRLPKPRIKHKKSLNKKMSKHRNEMKKKLKNSLDSWIVESDTSFGTDRDATNFTPTQTPHVATASKYSKKGINRTRRKNLFDSLDEEPEASSHRCSEGIDTNLQIYSDSQPQTENVVSSVHNTEGINSFVNAATSTPTNLNLVKPGRIMRSNLRNISICSTHSSVEGDPISRAQIPPADTTRSMWNNHIRQESEGSCDADQNSTSFKPKKTSHLPTVSVYSERRINETKNNLLLNQQENRLTGNSVLVPPNTDTNLKMYPNIPQYTEKVVNSVHNVQVTNSSENGTMTEPANSNLSYPGRITSKIAQSFSNGSTHPSVEADFTSRKQIRPSNFTRSMLKSRTALESDTLCVTDHNPGSNVLEETSNVSTASTYLTRKLNKIKRKNLFNSTQYEPEVNSDMDCQNTETNLIMNPENPPHIGGGDSPVHDPEVINSTENTATTKPTNLQFPKPERIAKKIAQNVINDPACSSDEVDPTSRKQMRPANVTRSAPKGRNGLLQKLRRLKKDNKPVNSLKNVNKVIDYAESTDEVENLPMKSIPESKKRIAHVSKEVCKEEENIITEKRTNVTRSMTKSGEISVSESPKLTAKELIHSTAKSAQLHLETKTRRVSTENSINNLCGFDNHDKGEAAEITDRTDDLNVNDVVNNILNSISDNMDTSENPEEHNQSDNVSDTQNIESNIEEDDSEKVITNISTSYPDGGPLNAVASSVAANEEKQTEVEKLREDTNKNDVVIAYKLFEDDNLDCSPERKEVNCTNTSTQNCSESQENNKNHEDCDIERQQMNSPVNSLAGDAPSANETISTIPQPNGTGNTRSLPTESANSTTDTTVETLRKRRRTDSLTKSSCEKTPEFLRGNNSRFISTLDELLDESELVSEKTSHKRSVPEIIQNEIGRFFNTKRIMTRSMKKSEESSPNLDKSQIIKITPLKRLGSPRILRKITTPMKSANNTPMNISKNFIKNLFSSNDSALKNSNSNNDNNPNQLLESSIGKVETANSITNISEIHCYNTNKFENKSETTTIYNASSELNNVQSHEFSILSSGNRMKIDQNGDNENSTIATFDRRKSEGNELPISEPKIYYNNDVENESTEELTNNEGKSIHSVDEKNRDTSPTFDQDSPLSPDPKPIFLSEYPLSPDTNTPLPSSKSIVVDSPYLNAVGILIDESSQQPPNIPQSQNKISIRIQPPTDLPKHSNSSVKELRNRKVPIVLDSVSIVPRNDGIISRTSEEVEGNITNIKSLFEKHFALVVTPEMKTRKFQDLAAKEASEEFINELKKEMERFVSSPTWDTSICQSVVDSLSKIDSTKSITRAIVDLIIDVATSKEAVDTSHTPPAPPMTPSQQKIITIVRKLEEVKPDLMPLIFNVINHKLFRTQKHLEVVVMKSLAKIFVVLSKIKKDRQRVRTMICDALYNMQARSTIIIHTALTSWPEVLPSYDENRCDYLSFTIVHIIKQQETKHVDLATMNAQLHSLINCYYKYSAICTLSANIADNLLKQLEEPNRNRMIITAILLLAKKEGTAWTYEHIIKEKLLKIIINNKNSSAYDALILLGYLMKCFPIQDADGSVKNIVEQLCGILNAGTAPVEIQEGAVMALISLSQRHARHSVILKSILMWEPPRPLSPALRDQLEILFKTRTCEGWRRIKI